MASSLSRNDSSAEECEGELTQTHCKQIIKLLLEARVMEGKRRKAMAQSSSADAYEQNGNETNDEGCSNSLDHGGQQNAFAGQFNEILERMNVLEKKQRQNEAEKTKEMFGQQIKQLQNEQKGLLEKISELEKQQQKKEEKLTNALDNQLAPILDRMVKMEENQQKKDEKWTNALDNQLAPILDRMGKMEENQQKKDEKWTNALDNQLAPILDRMVKMENNQQQKYEESEKSFNDQFSQLHNEQKTFLEKISDFEKQQQMLANQMNTNSESTVNANKTKDTEEQHKKNSEFRVKFNCWDVNTCHYDLTISGPNRTMVHRSGNSLGLWRTVFAEYSILHSAVYPSNIFYFELNVKNLRHLFTFGFAVKYPTQLDETIRNCAGTYAYESDGDIWVNGSKNGRNEKFDDGDTVGCGVNLANKQLIFTKNGHRIGVPNDFRICSFPSADLLFPFVSLALPNERIDVTFGPEFQFDLSTLG